MALFPQKKESSEYDINNSPMITIDMTDDDEDYPDQNYIISERCHDERERTIEFEEPINKKEVTANYTNGLLKISIKKIDPDEDEDQDLIQIM